MVIQDLETDFQVMEFSDIELREDSWVYLYVGARGEGKSFSCAYSIHKSIEKNPRPVFYFPANLRLVDGEPIDITELATFAEMDTDEPSKIDDAIVYIDEIHLIMSKYRANSWGNRMVHGFISQLRKRGCDLYGTTNSPNQLDEALLDAVDFHGVCKKFSDPECKTQSKKAGLEKTMHLINCRDTVKIRWADTQRRFGRSRRYRDGMKRKFATLHGLIKWYGKLYNTDATVSAIEISQLSKDSIVDAAETAKTGTDYGSFITQMQMEIIPSVVEAGGEWIYPNAFVETLKEQFNIVVTKERIGRACKDLGLEGKRGSQGSRYRLPEKDKLELFVSGVG